MGAEDTYLIRLAAWLARALGQTAPRLADFSTANLGVDLPNAVLQIPAVASAAQKARTGATKIGSTGINLESVALGGDESQILDVLLELGSGLTDFFGGLNSLMAAVKSHVTAASIPDPNERAKALEFADDLAKRIADYSIASRVTSVAPELGFLLKLAGLFEWEAIPRVPGNNLSRAYVRKGLRLDGFKNLISDPAAHLQQAIGWGASDFNPLSFFKLAREFCPPESSVEFGIDGGEPYFRGCVLIRRTKSPSGLSLTLIGSLTENQESSRRISDDWSAASTSTLRLSGGISGQVTPPFQFELKTTSEPITGDYVASIERNPEARPFDIVSGTGLVSISADNLRAGIKLHSDWNGSSARFEPLLFAELDGLLLKLGTDNADSFLGRLLAAVDIQGQMDLGLEWQASTGLCAKASGGMEIAVPVHRQLGPIELQTFYIALGIKNDGTLSLELSSALNGSLGPLSASVDRLGAILDLRFASGTEARFGPFDLDLRFKPPNGIGLTLDVCVVKGGGYLYIDTERGEYAGALELVFLGFLTVNAIGLITTRMP